MRAWQCDVIVPFSAEINAKCARAGGGMLHRMPACPAAKLCHDMATDDDFSVVGGIILEAVRHMSISPIGEI